MGREGWAVIAVALYLVAVVGSLVFFLRTVAYVLAHEGHAGRGDLLRAGAATAILLFMIIGGFVWFRFLGVGN